jgi:hypothetical protein
MRDAEAEQEAPTRELVEAALPRRHHRRDPLEGRDDAGREDQLLRVREQRRRDHEEIAAHRHRMPERRVAEGLETLCRLDRGAELEPFHRGPDADLAELHVRSPSTD